jgi:hypothetical protein
VTVIAGAEAAGVGAEAGAAGTAGAGARSMRPGAARRAGPQSGYQARHARPERTAPARPARRRGGQARLAPRGNPAQQGGQGSLAPQRQQEGRRGSPGRDQPPAAKERAQDYGKKQAVRLSSGAWHRIVIAEFIATVAIIVAVPFLVPRDDTSAGPGEEAAAAVRSLSLSRPLVRLTAVCILFFLLALSANGARSGRVAAAGGALIMLGTFYNATEALTALGQMFRGAAAPKKKPAGEVTA